jgi:hypothetical protein
MSNSTRIAVDTHKVPQPEASNIYCLIIDAMVYTPPTVLMAIYIASLLLSTCCQPQRTMKIVEEGKIGAGMCLRIRVL